MQLLGKEKFNKESVFVLNVINRFEENENIPLFLKILDAKMDGFIDDNEYHRLMILTDRTLRNIPMQWHKNYITLVL